MKTFAVHARLKNGQHAIYHVEDTDWEPALKQVLAVEDVKTAGVLVKDNKTEQ